jgi:TRAP-type C4-dicarboxylate transport system substrate-binding protein
MRRRLLAIMVSAWIAQTAAGAQPVVVKMATLVPDGSSWYQILKEMAAEWKTLSGGRVVVRLYPGGIAGDDADVVRKMRLGTLDAGVLTEVGIGEVDRDVYALGVPMMYSGYDEADHVLEAMQPEIERKLAAKGFVALSWLDGGWLHFFTRKPVATPDDLKALKLMSTATDTQGEEIYKAAGFHPVPLPATEIATALQTGLVTALQIPPQVAVITQYYTHAPYMTDLDWGLLLGGVVITRATWEKIPADLRPALAAAMRSAGGRLTAEVRHSAQRDVEAMKRRGLTVVAVDARAREQWRRTAESVYPRIRGAIVPAAAFDEALRLRDEYRRTSGAKGAGAPPHGP